jgi:hypothetical protein
MFVGRLRRGWVGLAVVESEFEEWRRVECGMTSYNLGNAKGVKKI